MDEARKLKIQSTIDKLMEASRVSHPYAVQSARINANMATFELSLRIELASYRPLIFESDVVVNLMWRCGDIRRAEVWISQ